MVIQCHLTSAEGKTMPSQAIMIENPWGGDFFRLESNDLKSFQMEKSNGTGRGQANTM